jgi:site-specific DNA-adenine methylase
LELGIPYMGSKRKLSKHIIDYILIHNPNVKYIYDLFGGGGAISFEALQRKQIKQVFYNELNTGVVELLKHIKNNGITPKMYRWVSRDEFNECKTNNDWCGGFLKTCWSFGNNQKNYLFGKEIEETKRLGHEVVVNNCNDSLLKLIEITGVEIPCNIHYLKDIHEKRKYLTRIFKHEKRFELQQLEQLLISNKSFNEVQITTPINETIIYLDPPYLGTHKYQKNDDNLHSKINDYIKNSPYKIYLSSYEWNGLAVVKEFSHRSTLSATANNKVVERLFCNQNEIVKNTLF